MIAFPLKKCMSVVVFPLRFKICKILLGKFAVTFLELQRANFSHFEKFGQIAYEVGHSIFDCRKNGFTEI